MDQTKGRDVKSAVGVLAAAKSRVLRKWRTIDASLQEHANEAKVGEVEWGQGGGGRMEVWYTISYRTRYVYVVMVRTASVRYDLAFFIMLFSDGAMILLTHLQENIKYVASIDKHLETIRSQGPTSAAEALSPLLNTIRAIHSSAK